MRLANLPTPCLVLDRFVLQQNVARLQAMVTRCGVAWRPCMAAARCIEVARLAIGAAHPRKRPEQPAKALRGIAVSTLAEAEYFASHDVSDILYRVAIVPDSLDQVAKLNAAGADVAVVTDEIETAAAIATRAEFLRVLIEIDTGEGVGLCVDDPKLAELAALLGTRLAGLTAFAGAKQMEAARSTLARAAERLTALGHAPGLVCLDCASLRRAPGLEGVTEIVAGEAIFGDLEQDDLPCDDCALTVLASVIGRGSPQGGLNGRLAIDAGAVALSAHPGHGAAGDTDGKPCFGLMLDSSMSPSFGRATLRALRQEQALVKLDPAAPRVPALGERVRVIPTCARLAAAVHDRFFVVDGGEEVVAIWPRIVGW